MVDVPSLDISSGAVPPQAMAAMFADIGRQLATYTDTTAALVALCDLVVDMVPGARWVSVTHGRSDRFRTLASSDQVALDADRLQYQLGTGPCVDAVINEAVFESVDLAMDQRWSQFGPQAARDFGTRSVLSLRLAMDGDEDLNAALNIYGDRVGAFDTSSRVIATLLATHAALAVAHVVSRVHAIQLESALESNREIGVAMGVLMANLQVTREQAFGLLRVASQNSNRKLRDIALDVADTGALPLPPERPRRD